MIEFTSDKIAKAEELLKGIGNALPRVQANAINRSLQSARAEAVRSVTQDYLISAGDVRKVIVIKNATLNNPAGSISAKGSPIPLSKFNAVVKGTGKKTKKSVMARVKRDGAPKPIKKAFIATTASGHKGVWIRAGKSRLPLKLLYGPSIPQMLQAENVSKQIEQKAAETLDKRLDHEINRVLEAGKV